MVYFNNGDNYRSPTFSIFWRYYEMYLLRNLRSSRDSNRMPLLGHSQFKLPLQYRHFPLV
jgi:hypothetical protein